MLADARALVQVPQENALDRELLEKPGVLQCSVGRSFGSTTAVRHEIGMEGKR